MVDGMDHVSTTTVSEAPSLRDLTDNSRGFGENFTRQFPVLTLPVDCFTLCNHFPGSSPLKA